MNEFIERNKRLLRFYCVAARICGWALLFGGTIWFLLFVLVTLAVSDAAGTIGWPYTSENFIYASVSFTFEFLLPGLIALLLAQLVRYMLESDYQPAWILQCGDKILYVYAVLLIGQNALIYYALQVGLLAKQGPGHLLLVQPLMVPLVVKMLILVGLGQILRRIIPVIEESKTLI
ncbi:MAG: hypothetical protein ACYTAO_23515 [Planctomycetota bacterium]|jgi:hypothetical protein